MEWWLNHVGQMAQSVQDYSEIILVLIGINLCTTAVVYIIKHNVVVWYFMIIACIIEIIVTRLEYDYLSKKNLHEKIINGEQW